ncbi:helix-turn-helix domain-containing protein [Actinomadura kijaniata]|uniref:helix-turn-helix domain-containing protein n=1 Tax=Actinomadura kijaniata TaxID=46161 RepID=UPI000A025CBC|nr:helix-turn-helix transcriptional regulator [Actinomadura kijaniata]
MANPPRTPESMNFGREVRKWRKRAKITQDDLAERLNVVRSYISQVETGATQCRQDFAVRMDEALGAEGEILSAWREFIEPLQEDPVFPQYFASFEKAEQRACEIRAYEAYFVNGLLQTEAYAAALLRDEEAVALRMKRQGWLKREPAPLLHVVLEESVLYREIGSREVMREQLERLIAVSRQDGTNVQVAPFAEYKGVRGSFIVATLPDRREVLYTTDAVGGNMSYEPVHLARVSRTMATLQAESLNAADTRDFIRKVIEQRWT